MTKKEFLDDLRQRLSGLPTSDVEERLAFYSEMIDDRIEEGLGEEEAVEAIGTVEEIADSIIAEIPLARLAKEKIRSKRKMSVWEITLLVLGSPVWLPLLITVFAVAISLYAVIWSLVATVWAVFASFAACAPAGIAAGVIFAVGGNIASGIAVIGVAIALAGLSIFAFFGSLAATKGVVYWTKRMVLAVKNALLKRREVA